MGILIKTVRIAGFRGLENIEVDLEKTTVLTGMNNSGKSSFLKALQLAIGGRPFVSQEDFHIKENIPVNDITIDIKIVPMHENGKVEANFMEDWEILFTENRIRTDESKHSFVPIRTIIKFDPVTNGFKKQQFVMNNWPSFHSQEKDWFQTANGNNKTNFHFDEMPFFYVDAQRDIVDDIKSKKSYLGKILSKIEYPQDEIKKIESQIKELNDLVVDSSDALSQIKTSLKKLGSAMTEKSNNIEVTPFSKKVRDLSKGLSIYYSDKDDSFSMEYHGMGTRSWSSLLILKAFISLLKTNAQNDDGVFFPILAIEEPESHLHPNAQKQLYGQIDDIEGQKIISTHSHFIAASAKIHEIRSFYKKEKIICGRIKQDKPNSKNIEKIKRMVIDTRGEAFFSKFLIFCEGETELQALPVLAEQYFGVHPYEMGLSFINVNGWESYPPFIQFANDLNVPWIIFSDGEEKVIVGVKKFISQANCSEIENAVFMDTGENFETQLIKDGFSKEIVKAALDLGIKISAKPSIEDLKAAMKRKKVQMGYAVARKIIDGGKKTPPKTEELFKKISKQLENRR